MGHMENTLTPQDRNYLHQAVELGRGGWGHVHPNPMVGCVLVRDSTVVGQGWHQEVGGPHAEIHALTEAGRRAEGATAYVSLEPCSHFGRTPPCTSALMEAGIARVVYGAPDPGRESSGGGDQLRSAGIRVVGPVFPLEEARRENPAFYFNQEHEACFVTLKLAQTLDGRIAEAPGYRTAITGPEARMETHRLRAGFDAVMVGSETVLVDNPLLTVREGVSLRKQPTRIVLDTEARLSPDAELFQDIPEAPLVIFTGDDAPESSVGRLEGAGASVLRVPRGGEGVSVEDVLKGCWEMGIRSLFCEGGGRLSSHLIRRGIARRLYLFVAPFVLGEKGVPAFTALESREVWEPWNPAAPGLLFGKDTLLVFDRTD